MFHQQGNCVLGALQNHLLRAWCKPRAESKKYFSFWEVGNLENTICQLPLMRDFLRPNFPNNKSAGPSKVAFFSLQCHFILSLPVAYRPRDRTSEIAGARIAGRNGRIIGEFQT
jgi:hypothetical protein